MMWWLLGGIAYGLGGIWLFRETYRDARRDSALPWKPTRSAWKDALECALGAAFWPVALALVGFMVFVLWLGFRQDRP